MGIVFQSVLVLFTRINNTPLIRGVEIATEHHEIGIKTGGLLTVFGNIIYNFDEKTLRIDNPLVFMKDREVY